VEEKDISPENVTDRESHLSTPKNVLIVEKWDISQEIANVQEKVLLVTIVEKKGISQEIVGKLLREESQ
jgi:hypothetical protein